MSIDRSFWARATAAAVTAPRLLPRIVRHIIDHTGETPAAAVG